MQRANETIHTPNGTIEKGTEVDDKDEIVTGREHYFSPVAEPKLSSRRRSDPEA